MKKLTLRLKLLYIVAITGVLFGLMSLVLYWRVAAAFKQEVRQNVTDILFEKVSVLDRLLNDKLERIAAVVNNQVVINFLQQHGELDEIEIKNDITTILKGFYKSNANDYGDIFITNINGEMVAATSKLEPLHYGNASWWKYSVNDKKELFYYSKENVIGEAIMINAVLPINNGAGRIIGVVNAVIKLDSFFDFLKLSVASGRGHFFLADSRGTCIVCLQKERYYIANLINSSKIVRGSSGVLEINGQSIFYRPMKANFYRETRESGGYSMSTSTFERVDFIVFFDAGSLRFFNTIGTLQGELAFIVIIFILITLLSLGVALFLVLSPVKKLKQRMEDRDSTEGKILKDIIKPALNAKDDICLLSEYIDKMSVDFKKTNEELKRELDFNKAIVETSKELLNKYTIEDVSLLILKQAQLMTDSPYGFVGYLEPKSGYLVVPTLTKDVWDSCNMTDKHVIFEKLSGLLGWVIEKHQSILVNNLQEDPRSLGTPKGHIPINRFISAPAIIDNRLIGQIALANKTAEYTQADMLVVERLALLYAISIEKLLNEDNNRQNEHILIHQSKLASMGDMFGSIVHQWRQPLNSMGMLVADLKDSFLYGEADATYIEDIVNKFKFQLHHISGTIDDFRNFFKPDRIKIPFDVNIVVREAVFLMSAHMMQNNMEILFTSKADSMVNGYPNELKQVIVILIINCKDTIIANQKDKDLVTLEKHKIFIDLFKEGDKTIINIKDDSGGISETLIYKVFDPYFSEKPGTTGIGLYMSKILIEKHMGGTLSVKNDSEGTVFTIKLNSIKLYSSNA
ncbi:MAG: GAF domain-containing protein [Candidatus Magnetoovum sp. WYHC-5]|nr:GAF domain-containing protein [Candidatus Magnetoovum sp. WYHC-5]